MNGELPARGVIAQHLCKRAGGDGRIAVQEILLQSYAIAHMIRENKLHQLDGHLQSASNDGTGTQSLDACIFRCIRDGLITLEEGMRVASYPDQLKKVVSELPQE